MVLFLTDSRQIFRQQTDLNRNEVHDKVQIQGLRGIRFIGCFFIFFYRVHTFFLMTRINLFKIPHNDTPRLLARIRRRISGARRLKKDDQKKKNHT